jgi:hypothetical protein
VFGSGHGASSNSLRLCGGAFHPDSSPKSP